MSLKKEIGTQWKSKYGDLITANNQHIFLYEVVVYKIYYKEARVEMLSSKFIKSQKEIKSIIKVEYFPNKKIRERKYRIEKSIEMVSAPIEYIMENKLPKFNINSNERNQKNIQTGRVRRLSRKSK